MFVLCCLCFVRMPQLILHHVHDNSISCLNVTYLFLVLAQSVSDLWHEQSSMSWYIVPKSTIQNYTKEVRGFGFWFGNNRFGLGWHTMLGTIIQVQVFQASVHLYTSERGSTCRKPLYTCTQVREDQHVESLCTLYSAYKKKDIKSQTLSWPIILIL